MPATRIEPLRLERWSWRLNAATSGAPAAARLRRCAGGLRRRIHFSRSVRAGPNCGPVTLAASVVAFGSSSAFGGEAHQGPTRRQPVTVYEVITSRIVEMLQQGTVP